MTKSELTAAVAHAETMDTCIPLAFEVADLIHASYGKVYLKVEHIAALVRYQAYTLGGTWDPAALTEVLDWLRYKVVVVENATV
ncbi:MAG: hypothetical protein GWN58_13635 [Anaerolineae bacterium]|nr:hypothetical protein [Anaerolineae bacterium]